MRRDPRFAPMMRSDLALWGVDKVDGAMVTIVGQIECTDSGRWPVQREFNRRTKTASSNSASISPIPRWPVLSPTTIGRGADATARTARPSDEGSRTALPVARPAR